MRHVAFIALAVCLTAGLGACAVEESPEASAESAGADVVPAESDGAEPGEGTAPQSLAQSFMNGAAKGAGKKKGTESVTTCTCCYVRIDGTCGCLECTSRAE